ncbi:saframycin Mx1 synthetase B [Legionella moravica]|uniref:Saframycin Mx1 synthetase B n=1 Tax=Legionella moravica TaxID=39962 RepID=A0A378K254_9GAMM|nr:fatty acyl-AMP ligase [Legionella moravica]KTD35335.1 saframycin Mx1 synthetase B [Legionella moravica]STX61941.1 saframycin Mx1 synthetase B [Legionella moravica]
MNKELQECQSLVDVLRFRALSSPQKIICTFLNKETEQTMTYAELDEQARAIAAALQEQGLNKGDRVLLLFSPGLPLIQAFFGCLYAGCIGVPIYPPAQEKLLEKAHRIIKNSKPGLVLLTAAHLKLFTGTDSKSKGSFAQIPCLAVDSIKSEQGAHWRPLELNKNDIAFLQYTSGSTMHPKGVMVSHGNLIHNLELMCTRFQVNEKSVLFSWLPPHHDMGLIGYILTPIYKMLPVIMMSPFSFIESPLSWLTNITKYKITISGSPNFAYDYCVKRISEEKKQGLDLSSWNIASNAAEPVRKETMEHFYQAFKDYGFQMEAFYPCYGLAEATLLVTCGTPGMRFRTLTLDKEYYQDHRVHFVEENSPGSHVLVGCGALAQNVKIVDPDTLIPCERDQVGEIWVHGESVALGYWEQKEETKHAFHGKIKGDDTNLSYLRTGDLGFIHDEELYVTGRIKDLIILYGKNHYPQDIEYSLIHSPLRPLLRKCAAFVIQNEQEYELTVVCEIKNELMDTAAQEELFNAIFKLTYQTHQLEINRIVLIPPQAIPHTTSGKIRRNFCRNSLLDHTLPVIATWQLSKNKE